MSYFGLPTYSMCVAVKRESSITESSSGPVLFTASTVINSACFLGTLLTSQNLVRLAWHCLFCVDVLNSAKLNAVHELSLCLTVPSSAWKWHRAGMNWKSEWLYEHKDRWQDPHWNVWPAHGCYLFSLSSSQQTHCDCGAAAVRFTFRAPRNCGAMHGGLTWAT